MIIKAFKRTNHNDPELQTVVRNIAEYTGQLANSPQLNGILIRQVALDVGTVQVGHLLGRVPTGWYIVRKNANADVWESSDITRFSLPLEASAPVTVDIWVF